MSPADARLRVVIEAKVGLRKDRLSVDGKEVPLHRERGGWTSVPGSRDSGGGRVRYDAIRDRIVLEGSHGRVDIQFRWRHTTFVWRGRNYRLGPMVWGHVMVTEGERPVATGRLTLSGVRLGYVAPELEPIARELVVGLAYRCIAFASRGLSAR